jgi:hypothetical protein
MKEARVIVIAPTVSGGAKQPRNVTSNTGGRLSCNVSTRRYAQRLQNLQLRLSLRDAL